MFNGKTDEIEKLVKDAKWEKIQKKYARGSDDERLAAAKALGAAISDEAYNMLVDLLKDSNPDVQLAAVRSLGENGTDRVVAQLQWVLTKTPESDTERTATIHEAIAAARARKR